MSKDTKTLFSLGLALIRLTLPPRGRRMGEKRNSPICITCLATRYESSWPANSHFSSILLILRIGCFHLPIHCMELKSWSLPLRVRRHRSPKNFLNVKMGLAPYSENHSEFSRYRVLLTRPALSVLWTSIPLFVSSARFAWIA